MITITASSDLRQRGSDCWTDNARPRDFTDVQSAALERGILSVDESRWNRAVTSPATQFQSGLTCDGMRPTPTVPVGSVVPGQPYRDCLATRFTSSLVRIIPVPNTQQDDHNPQRIQPRNLFELPLGDDNLFHGDKYKISLQLTAINLTNKYALYNFLSTFSGTHYVTPRALTAQLGFHF